MHHDFAEGDKVKIFPNESFGFLRITVERPLRLRWEVTEETRAKFTADKKIAKLSAEVRDALLSGLAHWGDEVITEKPLARKKVIELMVGAGQRGKALQDTLLDVLSVRDPDAPPVLDDEGSQVPDPDLRDYENVPLPAMPVIFEADVKTRLSIVEYEAAVNDYLADEVLPYISDAWIDHGKTKIGYEIPLTRHFYKYVPPRPLAEIDAEIKQLEKEIRELLIEVTQ